jgi:hypothetical protein
MKFEVRHTFAVPPETLWEALLDPKMEEKMTAMSQSTREIVEERSDETSTYRRVRIHSSNPAFAAVAKLLGSATVTFEHETTAHHAARRVDWRFLPPPGLTQIAMAGSFTVGPHAEGSERVAAGQVDVKLPLVGKTIEGKIIDAMKAMYDKGAAVRRDAFSRG